METLTIFDKCGKPTGSITFNCYAFGLIFRSEAFEKRIAQIVKPLAHVNINADGTGKGPHDSAVLEIAEKQFYEAFDEYLQPENGKLSENRCGSRTFSTCRIRQIEIWKKTQLAVHDKLRKLLRL